MKRQVLTGLACLALTLQLHAQYSVSGQVIRENEKPLQGASVTISTLNLGTITNSDGIFKFDNVSAGQYSIKISYVGYETYAMNIYLSSSTNIGKIELKQMYYQGEEATVSAISAGEKTPMAYTNINKEEIAENNYGRDIPYILKLTPSLISTSDAGNGIGYTSMRIRGTDANRINVTINGIPLNDAESYSVFWVDLPELASSTEQIQIQRGVGTSTNGSAAFGATVNLQTTKLNTEPYASYSLTAGSFNTLRNTVSAGTGLINDKFSVDLRLSDLQSDGYVDRSWTDLQSYYLSASWREKRSSLKFITFGGFEELYQSWDGVPSYLLDVNRTYNGLGAYTDSSGQTAYYENQIDHYTQIHYQLHYTNEISSSWRFNTSLHYTKGNGYYEEYKEGEDLAYYSMEYPRIGSEQVSESNLVRRKWLDNDFFGFVSSLEYNSKKNALILGGGWNKYLGDHFGKVIWAQYFGNNVPGHEWYRGTGDKTDWNIYSKYYFYVNDKITTFLDLQLRGINHIIDGTDANNRNISQTHSYVFFNPKGGINFEPLEGHRFFLSYGRANREPNRNNYTDAPINQPPVSETLNDFEGGYSIAGENFTTGLTLYYMDYLNQLVLTGQINEVGYPVMTNVEDSYRTGVELEFGANFSNKIRWEGNLNLSSNKIKNFTNYIDNWDYWDDPDNEPYQFEEQITNSTLAYAPSIVVANQLSYRIMKSVVFSLSSKYVSKQYLDNTSNSNFILSPYFVNDLKFTYLLHPKWADQLSFSILIPNLLNEQYESNAWLYRYYSSGEEQFIDGYYPQAGRYILLGFNISF